MKFRYYIFSILFFTIHSSAQELPPIVKYPSTIYGAGNQNWMISQDKNHSIFFANNDGLLEFNGSNWTLYPSPNETIVRSVKVIGNRVYSGCYMEFGYWKRQTNGQMLYFSISESIKKKILDDEQFWNIIDYEQWIVFQSLNRIYIYDTKSKKIEIITANNSILKTFKTSNAIYFQIQNEGLFEIENGRSKLVSNNQILKNNKIINVFSITDGLLIQTQNSGIYKLINSNLSPFSTEADAQLKSNIIYCSQMLSDGSCAFGTVSNGVYIISSDGKIKYHINQSSGLSNNTVLSLSEDIDKNLWIGLDNGINCINLQSPVKSFSDNTGMLGTVYASILYNEKLYIGTNQGLFCKANNSNEEFTFINGTKGQVWSLFEYDGTLFCGHDSGTFMVEGNTARLLFSQSGTWKFEAVQGNKNILLQGNYYGISVLQKQNNQWSFRNKISGFNYSSRFFEVLNSNEIYVSHEYKGVFRIQLEDNFAKTSKVYTYSNPKKGKNASLVKYNNAIYYACKEGVFKLNSKTKQFEKDKLFSSVFEKDEYTSGKLIVDKSNKIWLFSKNYIHYFTLSKLSNQLMQNAIPIPSTLTNSMLGFENISQLSNAIYLIGTTDGYYTININDLSFKNYSVSISKIATNKLNEKEINYSIQDEGKFDYDENNVKISYTVPVYNKYINAEYQYMLEGFQDAWSEWSSKSSINFKKLPSGNYIFKVRAKIANSAPENIALYKFTVSKPWYATILAKLIYFILLLYLAYYINKAYKKYYSKQEKKLIEENNRLLEIKELETEQQLMKIRNEQLSKDFDSKNKELAVSKMSLIKKNELLTLIKEDLKKSSEDNSTNSGGKYLKNAISTITKNITEDNSWDIFREAFDTADKDFLKKVKLQHPTLTPNDLRLCAYLRLNLSSKEIAPLLNISVRSIEIKRYRLRKKMDLEHEQGLVEYILSI